MVEETELTIYDTIFKNSDQKPNKKRRNYSDEEIIYHLEVVPIDKQSVIITKKHNDIAKRQKVITICDKQDV